MFCKIQNFKMFSISNRFLGFLLLLLTGTYCRSQDSLKLASVTYHSLTAAKTLELLKEPTVQNQFFANLDSNVQKQLSLKIVYPPNFTIKAAGSQITNPKKPLQKENKTSLSLSFDIAELPLTAEVNKADWSADLLQELSQHHNICFYEFYATISTDSGETLFYKNLYVLLSRQSQSSIIGYEHPAFNLGPVGLNTMIASCLPILFDSTNSTEFIQITALPALMADNFIQPKLLNAPKISTTINKNIVRYNGKNGLQYLRFQEPEYLPIHLKGKKTTPLSKEVQDAIRLEKNKDYIFLWEENRDVVADKNYKLLTIATVNNTLPFDGASVLVNEKTGLPLKFLKGMHHKFLLNNDTIASFSIQEQVTDSSHKKMYHQLFISRDNSLFAVTEKELLINQLYPYVLEGNLNTVPFKILNSEMNGMEGIREIYYNHKLVCIAQGSVYPEIFSVLDSNINSITLNQLLLMAFSRLL